jgi:hypothetical protein
MRALIAATGGATGSGLGVALARGGISTTAVIVIAATAGGIVVACLVAYFITASWAKKSPGVVAFVAALRGVPITPAKKRKKRSKRHRRKGGKHLDRASVGVEEVGDRQLNHQETPQPE